MQFHLDGFEPGDPDIGNPALRPAAEEPRRPLPAEVDVLIVGCGPAGLTLAAQLSAFPDIKVAIVEQKAGRLLRGQADGVACRTMEMFHAFGFSERVLREAYWVNETAFWKPDGDHPGHIVRSGRIDDTEPGLSEFPHVILNQARVHDFFLDIMRRSPSGLEPHYGWRLADLRIDPEAPVGDHAVTARFAPAAEDPAGEAQTVRASYVVGCDGARSTVRKSIGRVLEGDSANHAWGVMDVLAVTDFPDIRLKCVIQSAGEGSVVLIPREGGYLVRIYVELDKLGKHERVSDRKIAVEDVIHAAQRVFRPFRLDVRSVAWWSVYEIGQRLCDRFDDVPAECGGTRLPRVFIAGDACHTHSPKAGQGMNVSMQDSFNLGWKLVSVLRGRADPTLLHTYSQERQAVAKELIDFDREWAGILSASAQAGTQADPKKTQDYFVRHGRYTAGTGTCYKPSMITGERTAQALARGFAVGTRFHSAPAIRLADAKPVHLGHAGVADGRWRLYAFADDADPAAPDAAIRRLCSFLAESLESPVRLFTRPGEDVDAVIDVRAVFQQPHRELALEAMPPFLLPAKGRFGLRDYEKMFCPDRERGDLFDLRGIDRRQGCVVIVRPDQYVSAVLPLAPHAALTAFFRRFMRA